ncbi:MAG: hypothetical protein QW115_06105 [Thermoplasmata archaeon]
MKAKKVVWAGIPVVIALAVVLATFFFLCIPKEEKKEGLGLLAVGYVWVLGENVTETVIAVNVTSAPENAEYNGSSVSVTNKSTNQEYRLEWVKVYRGSETIASGGSDGVLCSPLGYYWKAGDVLYISLAPVYLSIGDKIKITGKGFAETEVPLFDVGIEHGGIVVQPLGLMARYLEPGKIQVSVAVAPAEAIYDGCKIQGVSAAGTPVTPERVYLYKGALNISANLSYNPSTGELRDAAKYRIEAGDIWILWFPVNSIGVGDEIRVAGTGFSFTIAKISY